MEAYELAQKQSLPLDIKIEMSKRRIIEWYEGNEGNVYVSFSGGKDSTVLLHLVRNIYPDAVAVFVDTGLEYPEIRDFIKTIENVVWLKPTMTFNKVIENYGYPVISKDVSLILHYYREGSAWAINRINGLNKDGTESEFKKRYKKWQFLLDAPFKISSKCCDELKEKPVLSYEKATKQRPIVGLMAEESTRRKQAYLATGCNSFDSKRPISKPMAFWLEQDVLRYIKEFNLPYAKAYGEIISNQGKFYTTGCKRTGCMFCMFGAHLDKGENKFQLMARTHPKQYDYCINKLGLGQVLDYIGVNYTPDRLF